MIEATLAIMLGVMLGCFAIATADVLRQALAVWYENYKYRKMRESQRKALARLFWQGKP